MRKNCCSFEFCPNYLLNFLDPIPTFFVQCSLFNSLSCVSKRSECTPFVDEAGEENQFWAIITVSDFCKVTARCAEWLSASYQHSEPIVWTSPSKCTDYRTIPRTWMRKAKRYVLKYLN